MHWPSKHRIIIDNFVRVLWWSGPHHDIVWTKSLRALLTNFAGASFLDVGRKSDYEGMQAVLENFSNYCECWIIYWRFELVWGDFRWFLTILSSFWSLLSNFLDHCMQTLVAEGKNVEGWRLLKSTLGPINNSIFLVLTDCLLLIERHPEPSSDHRRLPVEDVFKS